MTTPDLDDFELDRTPVEDEPVSPSPDPQPSRAPIALIGGAAATLVVAAAAMFWFLGRRDAPTPSAVPSPSPQHASPLPSVSPTPALPLPSLAESDDLVRELAAALSANPRLAQWLAEKDLLRRLAALVNNIASDESPRPHLGFLAPEGKFAVISKGGVLVVDPKSYARYDGFADAVASLDAAHCAQVFGRVEPLLDAAYRELGHPDGGFKAALLLSIGTLQATPTPPADLEVKPVVRPILVYEIVDPRLEALSPPQKHLLRMGPSNLAKIKAKLAELAQALGNQG